MSRKCPICKVECENVTRKGSRTQYDFCPQCETTWTSERLPGTVYFEQEELKREAKAQP
mgnify:CR=1 FL=1